MSQPKNLLEVLELLRAAGVEMRDILADGKVGITDLKDVAQLWAPAKAAITDAQLIPTEVAALLASGDMEAVTAVINKLVEIADAWVHAFDVAPKAA